MLKFIKHHMTSIGHIEIYPMISFIMFFLFFVAMILLVVKKDKTFLTMMQNLPLEDGTKTTEAYEKDK